LPVCVASPDFFIYFHITTDEPQRLPSIGHLAVADLRDLKPSKVGALKSSFEVKCAIHFCAMIALIRKRTKKLVSDFGRRIISQRLISGRFSERKE
jgi:hypothetical protein